MCDFLRALIQLAPDHCRLVIASRDYPQLGQSALAAEEELLEFTAEDLKFSDAEARSLLERGDGPPLTPATLSDIVRRSEGWPIAIQFTALSLRRGADPQRLLTELSKPNSDLGRYIWEQMLASLPDDMQNVVLRTGLLERLTGPAINLMCDRADGGLLLERMVQQGIGLAASPDRSEYRYHPLFAEYLAQRLARQDARLACELQQRAARFYLGSGDVVSAINHAVASGDVDLIVEVLEEAGGWRLLPGGLQTLVERALHALPPTRIARRPRLVLTQVYLAVKQGELVRARALFDGLTGSEPDERSSELTREIRVVGDFLAEYENQPMSLADLLRREALLRTLPADDHLVIANVSESLGAKYLEGGWIERALEPTLAARAHYQALGSAYSEIFTRFHEARIRRAQGSLGEASAILADTWQQIVGEFGERSDLAANCAAFQAELFYEQDRLAEALALIEWSLPHMEQSDAWVDVYGAAYGTAARALAATGALHDACAMLDRARETASRRQFQQLARLADQYEIEIRLNREPGTSTARAIAARIGLAAIADEIAHEAPEYRQVTILAALNSARLALAEDEAAAALLLLDRLRDWAGSHGAGRLLVDVHILRAAAFHALGEASEAQGAFEEAVGIAMFPRTSRPFVDAARFVRPLIERAAAQDAEGDHYREDFLHRVLRAAGAQALVAASPDALNDAEVIILQHLNCGRSNKEIARMIGMSPDTVKYRLKSVFRKMGVSKRRDAVRVSRERGYVNAGELSAR